MSSSFQESPRKAPADLQPLLATLSTALQTLQEAEAERRTKAQAELQLVEAEKAELADRCHLQEADLQVGEAGYLDMYDYDFTIK